ncbi:MAG: PHP domain-containing protein [Smithellaceae bacterium]|nr:PHP domain-containing protein [Smithellaceae bacterium]
MLQAFRCDLHVHTCLSPCAELDMYPRAIVAKAREKNLDAIAICDHNASENVPYVLALAAETGLKVFPGMEITSAEEVHVLAIFENMTELSALQKEIYNHLSGKNDENVFGCQAIVNELDEVEGFNERLLIGATEFPLRKIIDLIHGLGGLAVASHIDREAFGIIGQLGFIPPETPLDALEISSALGVKKARQVYPELASFAFVASSDAHLLSEIGSAVSRIHMAKATISELKMAFAGIDGRFVEG